MRSNLSVALVAMVNNSAVAPPTGNASSPHDSCPLPHRLDDGKDLQSPSTPHGPFLWPRSVQGLILSSFYWGYIVSQVPAGVLSKRVGGKWVLAAGTAWAALMTVATPWIARLGASYFIASRVLRGLIEGITYPAVSALLAEWVPRSESSFLFIVANMGLPVGIVVGQLMAGPLCASSWGWESVFFVSGAMAVVWLIPWCVLVTSSPSEHPRISEEELRYIQSSIAASAEARVIPWCAILTDPAVLAFCFCQFVNSWKIYLLLTCMPQFLSDVLHFDIKANGIASALPYIGSAVSQVLASRLADHIIASRLLSRTVTRKLFTGLGQVSVAGFMVGAVYIGCSGPAVVSMLVCMLTFQGLDAGGFLPNSLDLSPEFASVIFGLANMLGIGAGVLAPAVTGLVTGGRTIHEWRMVFVVAAGMAASAAGVFGVFGSGDRRDFCRAARKGKQTIIDAERC